MTGVLAVRSTGVFNEIGIFSSCSIFIQLLHLPVIVLLERRLNWPDSEQRIKDLLFALVLLVAGIVCILLMQFTSFEIIGIGGIIFPLVGLIIAFPSYYKRGDNSK